MKLCREAAVRFGICESSDSDKLRVSCTVGGINNWVYYVSLDDTSRTFPSQKCCSSTTFVVRLYNNGANVSKVVYEHQILDKLGEMKKGFDTPRPLIEKSTGNTFIALETGILASIFHVIPGHSPNGKLKYIHEMGKAAGELLNCLHEIYIEHKNQIINPTPPLYCDLWNVHHSVSRDLFHSYCKSSQLLEPYRIEMNHLLHEIACIEKSIVEWQTYDLPVSFVHGDLVTDNFLCLENGKVTGIIDFEFIGVDWIGMELATCVSKFPEEDNPLDYFRDFFRGFNQVCGGLLGTKEIQILPSLIMLRVLSNCIYFVGRVISGESGPEVLLDRIKGYYKRSLWLKAHGHLVVSCYHEESRE